MTKIYIYQNIINIHEAQYSVNVICEKITEKKQNTHPKEKEKTDRKKKEKTGNRFDPLRDFNTNTNYVT